MKALFAIQIFVLCLIKSVFCTTITNCTEYFEDAPFEWVWKPNSKSFSGNNKINAGNHNESLFDRVLHSLDCHHRNESLLNTNRKYNVSVLTISADYQYDHLSYNNANEFNIDGIQKYRDFHSGLLYMYAIKQQYNLRIFHERNSVNYQPDDVRWNKIMMLRLALHPKYGWAKDSKYIMWIDSDAIVLDFNFSVEEMFEIHYPKAHILMSADIRQGLVNSGVILLRNSPYTRQFLSLWWGKMTPDCYQSQGEFDHDLEAEMEGGNIEDFMFNRSLVCDQDAFDIVYKKYLNMDRLIDIYGDWCTQLQRFPMLNLLCGPASTSDHPKPLPPTLYQLILQLRDILDFIARKEVYLELSPPELSSFHRSVAYVQEQWMDVDPNRYLEYVPYYVNKLHGNTSLSTTDYVSILRMDSLNSNPPALLNQKQHNPILHLMGESSLYRGGVFGYAWNVMQECLSGNNDVNGSKRTITKSSFAKSLSHQLGLTQPTLLSVGLILYNHSTFSMLSKLERAVIRFEHSYNQFNSLITTLNDSNIDAYTPHVNALSSKREDKQDDQAIAINSTIKRIYDVLKQAPEDMNAILSIVTDLMKSNNKLSDIYEYLYKNPDVSVDDVLSVCNSLPSEFLHSEGINCVQSHDDSLDATAVPLILRNRIFYLLGRLAHGYKHYSSWYSLVFKHQGLIFLRLVAEAARPIDASMTRTSSSISTIWDHFRSLQTSYLHLLKRVAETGNDLFQLTPRVDEKYLIGGYILEEVLVDMLDIIHVESRPIPLHMSALMHQNLGLIYFETHGEVEIEMGFEAEGSARQKSIQHLKKSIEIFEHSSLLSRSNLDYGISSSTIREYILSLLLYTTLVTTEPTWVGISTAEPLQCYLKHQERSAEHVQLWATLVAQGNLHFLGSASNMEGDIVELELEKVLDWTSLQSLHTLSFQLLVSLYYHSAGGFLKECLDTLTMYHKYALLNGFNVKPDIRNCQILLHQSVAVIGKAYCNIRISSQLLDVLYVQRDIEPQSMKSGNSSSSLRISKDTEKDDLNNANFMYNISPRQQVSIEELNALKHKIYQQIDTLYFLCVELGVEMGVELCRPVAEIELEHRDRQQYYKLSTLRSAFMSVDLTWRDEKKSVSAGMDNEEWEECVEGEEGCEPYEVDVEDDDLDDGEEMPIMFDIVSFEGIGHDRLEGLPAEVQNIPEEEDDDDDDDDEEMLLEIRERYALQAARKFQESSPFSDRE